MAKAPTKTQRAAEIGARIDAHLRRFEKDPKINAVRSGNRLKPFYMAGAGGDRHRVYVRYVSYQGIRHISIEDAERYLAWLDAGNVGRHWEALK